MRQGLVEIIEACYQFDRDVDGWMRNVGEVVESHLGHGLGLIAIRYRLTADLAFRPLAMMPVNMAADRVAVVQRATADLPPRYVRATYAAFPTAMACSSGPDDVRDLTQRLFREHFVPNGWHDVMCINGLDPTHHGFYLGAWLPRRGTMTARLRARWSRVAAHLAAAHRLRIGMAQADLDRADTADAVLTVAGRIEYASDEAKQNDARAWLAEGARRLERARGKLRRSDPDLAVEEWRALLAARWSLVDHFESDGKRYVLARRNAPVSRGLDVLTTRERQAVGFAQLGHSNKLIAYEMGISASTVAVLLHRAARKLGCERRELVAAYSRHLGDA